MIFPQSQADVHMSTNKSNEKLHDGKMNFTQNPEVSSFSVQDCGRQETGEKAKVLAGSPEDLCAADEIAIL